MDFIKVLRGILLVVLAAGVSAQPLVKSATNVDPGNTKQTGATFTYRLTYNCSSTSGPCLNAQVVDLLPAELSYISTVPASPTGDVAAINVTPNFGGSGRTRVQFVMITPLPAGNSGDLLINVRFPNGSTPDGTVASNTADAINLTVPPTTFTTPPVNVTAKASTQASVSKTLTSSPANLDMPETYRLRISNSSGDGTLNLTSIGPITDTLPAGVVFNGATPTADCEPACIGTTPATLTWTAPCSLPLAPGANCDILAHVTFPSATFPSGTNVTNTFTGSTTALGQPPSALGVGSTSHTVTTFVPAPSMNVTKNMASGTPNPPTLNQTFSYDFNPSNNGNVPVDNLVITDTLPVQMNVASVTTGAYSGASDFAVGEGVRVSYEKNTALGVFTLWGSSPNATTNTTLTAPPPGLGVGEYLTRIRYEYGQAAVGMSTSTRPLVTGKIINPANNGSPVAFGNSISNCVDLAAVYTAGPTNITRNACRSFTLSGPFAQLNPAKDNLSGSGPFNPGQTVSFRLRVRSASQSSDPAPLEQITAADLLPLDLIFGSWTFDDRSTGLPAPQNFQQIPNYAGTGRTLLRWNWNAGSGSLGVGQEVWINISTTIRNGAASGSITNQFVLGLDPITLGQRCSSGSITDALDLDGDSNSSETLCSANGTANVAPIAQLQSSKTIKGTCDGGAVSTSAGTLTGGAIEYHLHVQNPGTVGMQNFVLIDILPFVGDTGVRDTSPRGSQWSPLLAAPIVPPSGTTVYYSTTGNPCRGEVGGPTSGCTPPNWTTVPPDPITTVRSFKLEFGSRVIGPADSIDFTYFLTTPGTVPPGANAYNSFAYQADRSDGLGSLAAEPVKVGLSLGSCDAASLGDYVWVDLNKDGIQNDGPTGLNGVYVELFSPGADGLPSTLDDVHLASAITADSPTSQPGWYRFPNLAPGSYYVKVIPPPTFDLTTPFTTSSANDSDGNQATGASGVVTLGSNEDNPTIDFGLVATHFAALGNYVWLDRNNDGVQNEPPSDGINGVTVSLFVDDGDGVPDAGDALVSTTVTSDDVYGQPGYYLFDHLIPGLPYYVHFVQPVVATGFTTRHAGGDSTVDSDAATSGGTTQIVILAPDEINRTLDAGLVIPTGTLALGDQVWNDADNDGVFEPQNGESGIDGVRLDLYRDVNNDGTPSIDEYQSTTTTSTVSGFAGRYRFGNLAPGNYIVVVHPSSFNGGGALSGLVTSTGNDPSPDPDDDANGDDNGTNLGALIGNHPVTLSDNGEPTSEDNDADTNLTVDFGFTASPTTVLYYDYGDAPDVGAGGAHNDYNTTVLDNGPSHLLGVPNAPYLGACVDADGGFLQNAGATADDNGAHSLVVGSCSGSSDEDGVTFSGPFTPGTTATFTVTAAATSDCHLDAFVDWDQNGAFNDPGEHIATNLLIPLGTSTVLTPMVPPGATPGTTYARFRCSSAGNLLPSGPASDGEVEDYAIGVIGYDLGDAPASYGTQGAGAARHVVTPGSQLLLGQCVDTELDGNPNANAVGDDGSAGTSRIGSCLDDEDGVTFTSSVIACGTSSVTVTANAVGRLDAWLDFNRNGVFDPTDQIFNNLALAAGANPLTFNVPCTASGGLTYARFRLSSAGGLGPTGDAPDGEVEDYAVTQGTVDFGDAPNSYHTLIASNGPRHPLVAGFTLGATIDSEPDGQPGVSAGDDGPDEDGVLIPNNLQGCSTVALSVVLNNTAGVATPKLDAWIDFDRDGHFDSPRDRIASGLSLATGSNTLPVTIPCDAKGGASYARFRLTSTGIATPDGVAADGEVEDYPVTLVPIDFGDAPDTYKTLAASTGPNHVIVSGFSLGATVDAELDGQPTTGAVGDGADEDGVTIPAVLQSCKTVALTVSLTNTAGIGAPKLDAWIDFDGDGHFDDPRDRIATSLGLIAGANTLNVTVPCDAPTSTVTYARFRLSSAGGLAPTGTVTDGEVEDYATAVQSIDFGDAPDTYGTTSGAGGAQHVIVSGFSLGATVDAEVDGQPSASAAGDGGDEDGVTLPASGRFNGCSTQTLTVTLTNTASIATPRLDAWIDFDGDGHFDNPRDRIATSQVLAPGANTVSVTVPCDVPTTQQTYARFRLSSTGVASPTGAASDGEVEDYVVSTAGLDFGDAPDPSYPTLLVSDGARHQVLPSGNPTLGPSVDVEANGQPTAGATGDGADEDGVAFPLPLIIGANASIAVTAGPTGGNVNCWIDFNANGSWADAGEHVVSDLALAGGGSSTVNFAVPLSAVAGQSYARCRISTLAGLGITGLAPDGEIEDYAVTILAEHPSIALSQCLIANPPIAFPGPGDISIDIHVQNTGDVTLSSLVVNLPLASQIPSPGTFTATVTSSDIAVNPAYDGSSDPNLAAPAATLAAGQTAIIHVVIHFHPHGQQLTFVLSSTASGTSPGNQVVSDISQDGCNADPDNDGDPNNNSVGTRITISFISDIPTLDPKLLVLLAALLAVVAMRRIWS